MLQFQNTTINNSVKPFTSFCLNRFSSPESALESYYSALVDTAAQVEALLDEPIELDEQWHYLPNLDGRRDGRQSYRAELRTYNDGLTLPIVFFKSFRHGGTRSRRTTPAGLHCAPAKRGVRGSTNAGFAVQIGGAEGRRGGSQKGMGIFFPVFIPPLPPSEKSRILWVEDGLRGLPGATLSHQ